MKTDAAMVGLAAATLLVAGCGKEYPVVPPSTVMVTNVVMMRRDVVVTNFVTMVTTNFVTISKPAERILSSRKTEPYVVVSEVLDAKRLNRLASDAGARVITCDSGALALVEAREAVASTLRAGGVMKVMALAPEDKIAAGASGVVRVLPLSSIDAAVVTAAIRACGGEIVQVVTVGKPAIRAKLTTSQMREVAERGDVRRIERDL